MKRTIFTAACVHSLNAGGHAGNSIVTSGAGFIEAVLPLADARAFAPEAAIVDFGMATITPGLTDSHIHITEWAVARSQVDLSSVHSIEAAARAVAAQKQANGDWITGRGWNAHYWGGQYPHRTALDAFVPDTPVALQSHDMHALWLNSRAMQLIGIDAMDVDPAGGRILRGEDGTATGVLLENAAQLVVPYLPQYTAANITPLVVDAQRELHSYGITAIHSFPGIHLREPDPAVVLAGMREQSALRLRVLQHVALESLEDAVRAGLRSGIGDTWICMGGVKMFLDGALGSRTAWMREPYEGSSDHGVRTMSDDDFRDAVTLAANHGIASVVHAIGDAAVTLAFRELVRNTQSSMAAPSLPHRVEHVQCLPRDCTGLLDKGVVCSVQPSHLMTDWSAADNHWGARGASTYAFRFMLDQGATLIFGSDAPVEPADPRQGLYAALTRRDVAGRPAAGWYPEQRTTALEALTAYTTAPARAAGHPNAAGIAPGALADFVAWRQDPLNIDPEQLLELQPAATVVGGEIVFAQ